MKFSGSSVPRPRAAYPDAPGLGWLSTNELVDRIRVGDREAAAEFFRRHGPVIRQRFRRKLGRSLRRIIDSYDVLESIARRLDRIVMRGVPHLESDRALWALVLRVGDRVVADHSRVLARLKRAEGAERAWAAGVLAGMQARGSEDGMAARETIDRAFGCLGSATDRAILGLWLSGNSHVEIGVSLGLEAPAVRKRWERIRDALEATFGEEAA